MFSPTHSGMRRAAAVIPTILLTLTGCGGSDLSMTGSLVLSGWGGHCCFGEEYASITVDCDSSDGERELGERSREPMPRVNVGGQFVVAAANILDKGVAEADHPYGTDLFETAHRP